MGLQYSFRQVRCEEVTTGPLESIPSAHIKLQPICDLTRVAFPEKESWGGLSFYTLRALGFGLQIIVYSQADHVAFTILDTNVNFLQRFYRASLGTPSFPMTKILDQSPARSPAVRSSNFLTPDPPC